MDRDAELRGWKAHCVELLDKCERLELEVARLKSAAVDAARAIDGEIKCCDMMRSEVARLRSIIDDANANLDAYDAGCLSSFGGGNVNWWQEYIRSELGRAHDFYQSQMINKLGEAKNG